MKLAILILIIFCTQSNAQIIGIKQSQKISLEGKIFNKKTGEKLSDQDLQNLIQDNPSIMFERVYNDRGEVEKFYYDPDNIRTGRVKTRDRERQAKVGEIFPSFVFTTIDNELIKSEDLKRKWTLLRFELNSDFINIENLKNLSNSIKILENTSDLIPIICVADSKSKIQSLFNPNETVFKIVADARNFHEIFNIVDFPTTVLIDPEGKVVKYYTTNDIIALEKDMRH